MRKSILVRNVKDLSTAFDAVRSGMQTYGPLGEVKSGTGIWQMMKTLHSVHTHRRRGCIIPMRVYNGTMEGLSAKAVATGVRFSIQFSKNFSAVA